eukprot:Tamp_04886.p2 GENE.Tamp_04886~~Tamp_04886.p2  ORF type:complete len:248 (+),score=24.39 Tamp_04886:2379-3122(+)
MDPLDRPRPVRINFQPSDFRVLPTPSRFAGLGSGAAAPVPARAPPAPVRPPDSAPAAFGQRASGVRKLPDFMTESPLRRVCARPATTALSVLEACQAVCARDPAVCGAPARASAAAGTGVTSAVRTEVLRRWEVTKLVAILPASALAAAVGLDLDAFAVEPPAKIAKYLFGRAGAVSPPTIAQARCALLRLLRYNHANDIVWDGDFGCLSELDLFAFLMSVHAEEQPGGFPLGVCTRHFSKQLDSDR